MRRSGVVSLAVLLFTLVSALDRVPSSAQSGASCEPVDRVGFLDGPDQIWRTPLAGGAPTPVTAPETASRTAVVSPDRTRVARFGIADEIIVQTIDGSVADVIIPVPQPVSRVDWSPDGTMLAFLASVDVANPTRRRLWSVPANNGTTPVAISGTDDAVTQFAWSPDSTELFYSNDDLLRRVRPADASAAPVDIYVGVRGDRYVWSPDSSRLAYFDYYNSPGSVHVVRADAVGGDTTLGTFSMAAKLVWSPDASRVYWNAVSAPANGSAAPTSFLPAGQSDAEVVGFSPDGSHLAFTSHDAAYHVELRVAAPDGSNAVQLGSGLVEVAAAVWSPDSTRMAYTASTVPNTNAKRVYVSPADGSSTLARSNVVPNITGLTFSPSGSRVVYLTKLFQAIHEGTLWSATAGDSSPAIQLTDPSLVVVPLGPAPFAADASVLYSTPHRTPSPGAFLAAPPFDEPAPLLGDNTTTLVPSPDHTKVAWTHGADVWVGRADGSFASPLPTGAGAVSANEIAWSPDGTRLAWAADTDTARQVYAAPLDGSSPTVAFLASPLPKSSAPVVRAELTWSPDGTHLAFHSTAADPAVYVADPAVAGSALAIADHGRHPAWAPDGSVVAYASTTTVGEIDLVAPAGGSPTVLGSTVGTPTSLAWEPNGNRLAVGSLVGPLLTWDSSLRLLHRDGQPPTIVGAGLFPTWSADGSHLAWEEWHGTYVPFFLDHQSGFYASGERSVGHVAAADLSDARVVGVGPARLVGDIAVSGIPTSSPLRFTPNGDAVAFADRVMPVSGPAVARMATPADLWRFPGHLHDGCLAQPAGYHALPVPFRVLDTRDGTGAPPARVGPGAHIDVTVAGVGGVPADAAAVVLNLTAVNPTKATHLTTGPTGAPMPPTSTLNLPAGDTRPNLALVPVGAGGKISITNNDGAVDIVGDVAGWSSAPEGSSPGALLPASIGDLTTYRPVPPARVLDTRTGVGAPQQKVAAGADLTVDVVTGSGVAPEATAVVVNLTAVNPSAATHITARAFGEPLPLASNINLPAGATRSNLAVVRLGDLGRVTLRNNAGEVDLLLDVVGWLGAPTSLGAGGIRTVAPARVLDTRDGTGVTAAGPVGGGSTISVPIAGRGGVPVGAHAVVLNITGVLPSSATHVTAWADGATMPATSSMNLPKGVTVASLAVVQLSPEGKIALFNNAGQVDLVGDVMGYIA